MEYRTATKRHALGRGALVALVLFSAACSERSVTGPEGETPVTEKPVPVPEGTMVLVCTAEVRTAEMKCVEPAPKLPDGVRADRILGSQDVYVRLTSSGTAYDIGTQIFSTTVTVQNLTQLLMGTGDGVSVEGVKVFFASGPTVTGGSGTASVANADGTGFFTSADQAFYNYNQMLTPLEISNGRSWLFSVDNTVENFVFTVYVAAAMIDESAALLGSVWTGTSSTSFADAGNWVDGAVPDSSSTVTIPLLTMLDPGANMPALVADVEVTNLRIGAGSSLNLAGFTITVNGNTDAVGTAQNGTIRSAGSSVVFGGSVPAVVVNGSVRLQRPTVATAAVSVSDGTLTVKDQSLSIKIP